GAVVQLHLEVHHGVSGHRPARRRFLDTSLHRRDILPGNHSAHDFVQELEARAARQWCDPDPAVPVLTSSPRLLLVLALPFSLALERFAIGDLWLADDRVDAEFAGQPTDDDLEMTLAQSPNERLRQLPVVLVLEGGVL